ncbi:MAG: hypothetical protein WAT79_01025 [Saprospiraceae bacterium]
MEKVLDIVADATNGKCYTSFRYCADDEIRLPTLDFDSKEKEISVVVKEFGETDTNLKKSKSLKPLADNLINSDPLFHYFLDGSRRTYKVDDIEINRNVYPIMAGQIGVACCQRKDPNQFKCAEFEHSLVLSLPKAANPNGGDAKLFFNSLTGKINKTKRLEKAQIEFSKILSYESSKRDGDLKYEHKGIASIQDEMIDTEKRIVAHLSTKNIINPDRYLIKDGSLQYAPSRSSNFKELSKFKSHYKCVIGISKMFDPELCRDNNNKSNADKIAILPNYHRTPAYKYKSERVGNVYFAVWYVRIRESQHTFSPFSGIVKVEKILISEDEIENGLDSAEIDTITANIINERNPVCYGKDARWANHLYPVYLTESFIKSKYLSDLNFLNLF